ncbi:MAG: DNA cytosine methyltransferase [Paludibaculum sp.]
MKEIIAADLFCGAGGTSEGLRQACEARGLRLKLTAINHWDVAIATHSKNHPDAEHHCMNLDNVDPRKLVPGGRLHFLAASPECTHHSVARGGKPINDQSRATAWAVLRWAEALYIDTLLIENVKEFTTWGPCDASGRPIPSRKGEIFQTYIQAIKSLGYSVDYRVLNAANYGDPTTRERLFIQARRGNKRIHWPEPTHLRSPGFLDDAKPWRTAREIIDWDLRGESIFRRKKPLANTTLERIAAGLRKFGGRNAEPFLVALRQHMRPRSVDEPLPTITAGGNHLGLVQPFVLGQQSCAAPRAVDDPLPTISTAGAISLVEPFVFSMEHGAKRFIIPTNHGHKDTRTYSIDDPMPTITTVDAWGVVEPFLVGAGGPIGQQRPHSVDEPLGTVLTDARQCLVEPFIVQYNGNRTRDMDRAYTPDEPLPTVTAGGNRFGLVEPFLMSFYGSQNTSSLDDPAPTMPATDVWSIVLPDGSRGYLDILFRMLQPHELAAAQGFPKNYHFTGTREARVKQIGNAVPPGFSRALSGAILDSYDFGSYAA